MGHAAADIRLLRSVKHICILEPADDVEEILKLTRVVLVPSLWAEAKGNIIMEAMLRGILVLASDVGGTAEAMLGLHYLIPVNPITNFLNSFDDRMLPIPIVPIQDLRPWHEALNRLLSTRGSYESASISVRTAAIAANAKEIVTLLEQYLSALQGTRRAASRTRSHTPPNSLDSGLKNNPYSCPR